MIIVNVHGRMGNQYFQYAFARNLQIELEKKYKIHHDIYMNFGSEGDMLAHTNAVYRIFDKKINFFKKLIIRLNTNIAYIFFRTDDKKYKYSKFVSPLLNIFGIYYNAIGYIGYKIPKRKNYILDGYFQCEKYFKNNKEIIKKELRNRKVNVKEVHKNSVCLHIRRGDYIKDINKKFLICTLNYYQKAISILQHKYKNLTFYIFSDDIEWVKENLKINSKVIYEELEKKYFENFEEMYNCENFVLSNSSYSWWAQYLSLQKKYVLAPSIWNAEINNNDIYLDDWHLIKVGEE